MFIKKLSKNISAAFLKGSKGATLLEYVLIASLLIGILIGAYKKLGVRYFKMYSHISDNVP